MGDVVPGVTIRARHENTNAVEDAVSDAQGLYSLRGLPVGRYTVPAELSGFQTFVAGRRRAGQRRGAPRRESPRRRRDRDGDRQRLGARVDTNTSTLRTVVDQQRIENLPLNGRNPTQLMTLVAGVLPDTRPA